MLELLRALELAGCIVTADALRCQKRIAREIVEADADYVLALKRNQGAAFTEVKAFVDEAIARHETHQVKLETLDKDTAGSRNVATGRLGSWNGLRIDPSRRD